MMKNLEAKIVVLGSQGVGKTSVVIRYVGKMFSKHVSPTIGASFFTCKLTVKDHRVKLQLWDTAGQERFRAMAPMYYRNSNAAFLVFDITSQDSFLAIKDWVKELKRNVEHNIILCMLGNKCDLDKERVVKNDDARQYAASIGAFYFETSAVYNEGIEEAFLQTALSLINLSPVDGNSLKSYDSTADINDGLNVSSDRDDSIGHNDETKTLSHKMSCC